MATDPTRTYKPRHFPSGGPLRRHVSAKPSGRKTGLAADHPAVVEGRTKYPHSVVDAEMSPRLLIEGKNQRKIGDRVVKGRWTGMPIFCLTLEERATCPTSCREWSTCLPADHRILTSDLRWVPLGGIQVGQHIAAFQEQPVESSHRMTEIAVVEKIGRYLAGMNADGDRCWIRFSGDLGAMGSLVIADEAASVHVLCPAQTGKTDCCGTCGLCWTMQRPIEFERH